MNRFMLTALLVGVLTVNLSASDIDTVRVDAVALLEGRETEGDARFTARHGRYLYLFANSKNQEAFSNNPARYEIQLGGACARMGALSGVGRTNIYSVHDGKLFIFASTACRKTFRKDPSRVLEQPDEKPETTESSLKRSAELLAKILEAVGGAEKVDAVKTYSEATLSPTIYQGKNVETTRSQHFAFPDKVRDDQTWDDLRWSKIRNGESHWFVGSEGETRGMVANQPVVFEQSYGRNLLYILRARNREDFVAVASGEGLAGFKKVEFLTVHFGGTTSKLGVDPKSGRVLSISYRGWGPSGFLGEVERYFSDFQIVEGLTLPITVSGKFDGEIVPPWSKTFSTVAVNETFEDALFKK